MNKKYESEHEDDLGPVKWHEDKMGTLNALFFRLLISIFDEKILVVRLVFMFAFFPVDSSKIHVQLSEI